jgi:8-oxo-dGTP pyrophosphatase MutT (NUDIX family)
MIVGAGVLFKSPSGKILFCRRTDGKGWAFPGGVREDIESTEQCAIREAFEETDYRMGHVGKFLCRRVKDDVDFTTFIYDTDGEFTPHFNYEHDAFVWATPDAAMQLHLHPGVQIALCKLKGMNELELAQAIRDQELVSPQYIENVCLVDMRISGTGFSFRPKLNEWVFRRDTIYLTTEFLQRCNGIPIIMEHPSTQILNSDEFANRIVGTMFLPYLKGDEVWGVAKIYDKEATSLISTGELSTSPSVVFRDPKVNYTIELEEGGHLLVEGEPSFVDHLAICERGVWDKGVDASGIRVDSGEVGEPQEKVVTAKLDGSEFPASSLPVVGEAAEPDPMQQGIPPNLIGLVDSMGKLTDRIDKFLTRRDLMVR